MAPGAIAAPPPAADRYSRWAAVAIGASIPISVSLDNVLLALVMLTWIAGGAWREKWRVARGNPVAVSAVALFAVLAAGTLYGDRYPGDATAYLGKYLDLLAVPALVYLFRDTRHRACALAALAGGLLLVLAVSYLVMLGLLPQVKPLAVDPGNALAFKYKLTHNILMAFAAFLFAHFAARAADRVSRCAWAAAALLAALNLLFLVDGLTGQVLLGAFVVYGTWRWKGWRGLAAGAAVAVLGAVLLIAASDSFRGRLGLIASEVVEWQAGRVRVDSSGSTRLELAVTGAAIVRDHPLLGVGMGGYPKALAERSTLAWRHPHSEFLLVTAQNGVVGLAVLLWLFFLQWRMAARLPELEGSLARGLVVMMLLGCIVNSMLIDHTEGLLYAWLTGVLFGALPPPRSTSA